MSARPARLRSNYVRQLTWFVLAIVVPSVVVVGLGIRTIREQDELAEKHAADERRLLASDFERALLARLEAVRHNPHDVTVTITARLVDGRVMLPWDQPYRTALEPGIKDAIAAAEHDEFQGRLAAAESRVRGALAASGDSAYARLVLARVLSKEGKQSDASLQYRTILQSRLDITDENGIPLACYAAERLVSAAADAADEAAVAALIDAALTRTPMLPPAAWYALRTVAARLADSRIRAARFAALISQIDRRIGDVEHALALQRDAESLVAGWRVSDAAWLPYGTPLWLVGLGAPDPTGNRLVLAATADTVTSSLSVAPTGAAMHLVTTSGLATERLGDLLPGISVRMTAPPATPSRADRQRAFSIAALAIVVGITVFGGYLLLRDVHREMRLADMRAQFVSSVSHELRTPLTAIRMFAETLQLDCHTATTRHEYLDTIVNESERLTRLLDNVLDFSKIEQGRRTYRRQAASLPAVVHAAARAVAYPLAQYGFVLRVDAADDLPLAEVDADAIEQATLNLLTNAMKYSGESRTIELRLARDGSDALIAVRDRGIGIAANEHRRVFEKFYRVEGPETTRIPGTGLGLTLVQHIVTAHGGRVDVESMPGAGSTFTMRLPLGASAIPVAEALS